MDEQAVVYSRSGPSSTEITFKKRKGTTDVGKDYENLLMANVALNLMDSADDFHIWSNDENYGSFDDVIFETSEIKCAIQLKHSMAKKRQLILNQFLADKGDFSVQKYFQSFLQNKTIFSDYKLIIFTNLTFNPESGKKVTIKIGDNNNQQIDVTISKPHVIPLLSFSVNNQNCFQFKIISESCTNISPNLLKDCETFFENFFVYTNQKDVRTLEEHLVTSIKEKFSCRDEVPEQFLRFFTDWNLLDGTKVKLSQPMIKQLFALHLVSRYSHPFLFDEVTNKNYEILQTAMLKFNVTLLNKKYLSDIQKIPAIYKIYCSTKDAKFLNRNYRLAKNERDNLSDEAFSKLLWLMDKCPLIVDENPEVYEAIKLCDNKSFIVLTDNFQKNVESTKIFQKLSDLKIHEEIYNDLIVNYKLLLSGKEICLAESLKNNECQETITTNDLLLVINNNHEIQQETEKLSVPYIPRLLSRNFVDLQILNDGKNDALILISNANNSEQNYITKKYNFVDVEEYLQISDQSGVRSDQQKITRAAQKTIFVVSKNQCTTQKFRQVCNKKRFKSYHHLKFVGNKLEWVQSVGDITSIQQFRLQNGSIKEDKLQESNFENNIHLVVGNPGLGKSLLLKSLKNQFISNNLTTLITPHDMKQICHFYKIDEDINKLNEHILKIKYPNWSQFDHHVVNSLIKTQSIKVIYLWDALDEIISDQNREVIIKIIHKFSEQGIVQWMTCRQHLKSTLESQFKVLSQIIFEFDEDQQIEYIKVRLQSVNSIQNDLHLITEKIIDNVALYRHRDILSIPLQIYMLTETLRENKNRFQNFTQGFFSLGDLYEYFVDEKMNFCYKKNPKLDNSDIDELTQEKQAIISQLETFALKAIFSDDVLNDLHVNIEEIKKNMKSFQDRFGLVTEIVNSDQKIKFAHISYAEYLVARYLVRQSGSKIKNFIFEYKCTNVRYFFDFILAKDCPAHVAVLCDNISQLRRHKDKIALKDAAGRNPLQLACSWGKRYQIQEFKKSEGHAGGENFYLDNEKDTFSDNHCDNNLELIDMLSAECDVYEKDTIFEMNAINYAEVTDNIFALGAMEEKCNLNYFRADNYNVQCNILYLAVLLGVPRFFSLFKSYLNCLTINNWTENSLLHFACKKGRENIVEMLIDAGADINASNRIGDTPLLVACGRKHDKIVKVLINKGAEINACNVNGLTPLIRSCAEGHEKIVKLLINRGIDINASNINGSVPLILACSRGHEIIVELLINSGANINISNVNGSTPLILACRNGNKKLVEYLINNGADVNAFNKNGETPLIFACSKGQEEIVELLINEKADVNAFNKNRETPLIFACAKGQEKTVELLINKKADVNASNKNGETALIFACCAGHEKIVELLINNGADINASNKVGDTPLKRAWDGGHVKIVELLVKKGTDVSAYNKSGETSLTFASDKGNEKIIKLLEK